MLVVLATACARRPSEPPAPPNPPLKASASTVSSSAVEDASGPLIVGGKRPVEVYAPPGLVKGKPAPLLIMLHAYGATSALEELFFRFHSHADTRGFVYVKPDGTPNAEAKQYWNATDACCAPPNHLADGGAPPDDVEYLREIVGEIASRVDIDKKRIYLVGHSNGGFMAHRMACDHPELFAAVVSVAGATFHDSKRCKATAPISVLQIHGTADATIHYEGGTFFGNAYPSAKTTAERWVALNDCTKFPIEDSTRLDLDVRSPGKETHMKRWVGCRASTTVELWTMDGSGHVPLTTGAMAPAILDWLDAHPKT